VRQGALARDADARRIVSSRLEIGEQIPRTVRHGAVGPFAKCSLGERDADARGMVSSRLEISWGCAGADGCDWATDFAAGQKRPLELRSASHSRILSSIITIHASTPFD